MELSAKDKRLFVMSQIQHPETYYQRALKSQGVDTKNLTHSEISVFKAAMLAIEADAIIYACENNPAQDNDAISSELLAKIQA